MKLTEDQVKNIIVKVNKDLNLYYSEKYPIFCTFHLKNDKYNRFEIDYWGGGYDYRDPEAVGDEWFGEYPEYLFSINDETGEAFAYHYYSGHVEIKLNKQTGKYEAVKQLFRP